MTLHLPRALLLPMKPVACLLLSLTLLAACERTPEAPSVAASAPVSAAPEAEVAPAVEQTSKPAAAAKPVAESAPAKTPPARTQAKPATPAAKPQAALDLTVPHELLESLSASGLENELAPLLPPLFGEKKEVVNPFQISGRLISNERVDDYWDSIEGAELQFEFKQ